VWIIVLSLEFPALRASVFVACGTLPSGRNESIAVRIRTPMNKLICGSINLHGSFALQLIFGAYQINPKILKLLDLVRNILDLCVYYIHKTIMRYGSLGGRKHGLFLCK
jgi:hypothetical protein